MAAEASGTTASMGILTSDASHKAGGAAYDVVKYRSLPTLSPQKPTQQLEAAALSVQRRLSADKQQLAMTAATFLQGSEKIPAELRDRVGSLYRSASQIESSVEEATQLIGALVAQTQRAQGYIRAARMARDLESRTASDCRRQVADLGRECSELRAESQQRLARVQELEKKAEGLRSREDDAMRRLKEAQDRAGSAEDVLASREESNAVLRSRVLELERTCARLRAAARGASSPSAGLGGRG